MISPACSRGAFLDLTAYEPDVWTADLAALDALGLDHVELWLEFEPTRRQLGELARLVEGRRTIMHGPFVGMSLATEWERLATLSLERCRQAIEAAATLGCEVVTFHAGAHGAFGAHEAALERLAERIARFARLSAPLVAFENLPIRRGATVEALGALDDLAALRELVPEISFNLDVGHCLQNGDAIEPFLREHGDAVHDIHLHDGLRGGRAHLALGTGELDLDAFVQCLEEIGYDRFLTFETLGRADLSGSLERLRAAERSLGLGAPPVVRAA